MKKVVLEAMLLAGLAIILAFAVNSVSSKGISLVGTWYDNRHRVELDVPPSYSPETDTLLTMQEAFSMWKDGALFIDTREPDEYAAGHIPGAVNLPFEEWDDYWECVEPHLKPESKIVCYCSGLDCELSLFAARELKTIGYPDAYIFFGGYNKWMDAKMPYETGTKETENPE
jgi:rhodanese-related sulfurtransferase